MASNLENKFASLRINKTASNFQDRIHSPVHSSTSRKPQKPVVPKSYAVGTKCEPSYTSPLQIKRSIPVYSNVSYPSRNDSLDNIASRKTDTVYSNIQKTDKKVAPHIYSNINTYSNCPPFSVADNDFDDFPPPPPEPDEYGQYDTGIYPPPPDDLPPPPSPVSSSYSELRRATQFPPSNFQQDYGFSSRDSSTYESIYEPINPRPPSEMSSRSNYSLYGSASTAGQHRSTGLEHENEVDTLTDLLVQSMDSSASETYVSSDTFGECCKCGKKIADEESGCTTMNKMYHISCFSCYHCNIPLQDKPFYSLDGKPYCEQGYLETFEKCSVCQKPVLDRILRATGRPYHPHCFTCVVCGISLDGITFTVDAANQIHCIEDFHKKFAPRCCVCKQPIMPEPGRETVRVVALDRSFHINCYKCEDCGVILSNEVEGRGYPLDDHILCKSCNAKRVQALSVITTDL